MNESKCCTDAYIRDVSDTPNDCCCTAAAVAPLTLPKGFLPPTNTNSTTAESKTEVFAKLCSVGFVDSGYRYYGSLTELTEVPGTGMEVFYRTHRSSG